MKLKIGTLVVLAALSTAGSAVAKPVNVNVRVEGAGKTLFEGTVSAQPEQITKDASGAHPCDGTNGGTNAQPGATPTGALDAALRKGHVAWSASWSNSFNDFLINSIGADTGSASSYWLVAVNYKDLQVGGCQFELHAGDQVLWYYGPGGNALLKLSGPRRVKAGHRFRIKVVDGRTGKPVAGATVAGHRTRSDGTVALTLRHRGHHRLKAELPGAERSNALRVTVSGGRR